MPDALKLEAQFNRVNISRKDFTEAEDYLRAYGDELSGTLRRALLVAAIVAYARPFTSNEGGTKRLATVRLTGNPKRILSSEEFRLHEQILGLRNEAVAHSDYDRKATWFIERLWTGSRTKSKPFDVLSETIPIDTFLAMCTKMWSHCTGRLQRLSRELPPRGG
jgi:hypothetical protein